MLLLDWRLTDVAFSGAGFASFMIQASMDTSAFLHEISCQSP